MRTALLLPLCGCSWLSGGTIEAPPRATEPAPDVVVITLDTTRADHLGAWGAKDAVTPTLDAMAATGVRYARAYSPVPLTIPAHAAMFTGLWPFHTNIRDNGDNVLAPKFLTLAERLRSVGYATAASVGAFVTTRQWGLAQGFDAYFDVMPQADGKNYWHVERSGDLVVDDALDWLSSRSADKPVFLWVHLYDAHFPYVAREGQPAALQARPYDAEIAFVDTQVARLVSAFAARPTLFAVVGDHGEALGEHGETTHGMYVYDATQHVPWILTGAGLPRGVVEKPVSTVALTPTLLHALGLEVTADMDLAPAPSDDTPYMESYQLPQRAGLAPHRAVVDGPWKLIATPRPELYDVTKDAGELQDQAAAQAEATARLQERLAALGATPPGASGAMDAQTLAQLAALGYLGGGTKPGEDPHSLPDPKDFRDALAALDRLDHGDGQGPEARMAAIEKLIADLPTAIEPRMRLVPMLMAQGRRDEARALLEESATLFPDVARVWLMLSTMALQQRDTAGAVELAQRGLEADPTNASSQEQLILAMLTDRQLEAGLSLGREFLRQNPQNHGLAAVLADQHMRTGKYEEAAQLLVGVTRSVNPRAGARTQLAWLYIQVQQTAQAEPLLDAELAERPNDVLTLSLRASLYEKEKRWADQLPLVRRVARLRAKDPLALLALAQCHFNLKQLSGARTVLDEALALAPEDPRVLLLHANLLAKEGRQAEADAVFARGKELYAKAIRDAGMTPVEAASAAPGAQPPLGTGLPGGMQLPMGAPPPGAQPAGTQPTAPQPSTAPAPTGSGAQ